MAREPNPPYKWLAQYYDELFLGHRGSADRAREVILGRVLSRARSACDLACGTGTTALLLARAGIAMCGVDVCPAMCRQARTKARRAHLPLRVLQADMRSFRLPQPVDLVLCEFDALNHIPNKADLARVARSVARALRPGGHFYFDVNNRLAFQKVWTGCWWYERPGLAMAMHGGYDRRYDRGWTNVEWFFQKGRYWQRRRERVEQVCWTGAEIRETLRLAGFDRVRAWDGTPFFGAGAKMYPGCRTFYLARKAL